MSSTTVPEQKHHRSVMIVAGEASGDMHGANLVREMKALDSSLSFFGVGGKRLEAQGVRLVARSSDMAVVGITEVFTKIRFILGVFFQLRKMLREEKPKLLILIDYPDFNLRLASAAKKAGVRVFYYISPQVWAWRTGRVRKIRRVVDKMAVILPFEKAFYAKYDYPVEFVGHPLLDVVKRTRSREQALTDFGLHDGYPIVALLPGSREKEVKNLLPEMLGAAVLLKAKYSEAQFILPQADTIDRGIIHQVLQAYPVSVTLVSGQVHDAVGLADVALVASGTATLETALLEIPMIIIYRISPLTAAIGKRLIRLEHIGLVNIIAGKTLAPELIQENASASRIADETDKILSDRIHGDEIRKGLAEIRKKLGAPGASGQAALLAAGLIKAGT
ncbi:MAG: lipid-A-disaccharide synthase [Syntrophaceae bacterium]|nr:lipid-A-disaccharide synthase [Syntrophaceae bacterium]